jgi:hypothetical protein
VPFFYPERTLRARQRHGGGRYAAATRAHRIPRDRWPEIIARVEREGLRPIARDLGVSHEAVRTVLVAAGRGDLLADAARTRRLAAAAPPPPPAARKIPQERYGEIVALCQRHTQAEVAALLAVSQTTVWRVAQRARREKRMERSRATTLGHRAHRRVLERVGGRPEWRSTEVTRRPPGAGDRPRARLDTAPGGA